MFLGNLRELKGAHILIEALGIVKRSIPDIYLLIAGSGSQEARLKAMVSASGLEDNVSFMGFIRGDEKFSYIKASRLLVLPSFWEALPITVLEGMACGKAVVASAVGGVPYLVHDGENGYLVRPGNAADLATRIVELLDNDVLLAGMGADSLRKVQDYRWEKIAVDTYSIYCMIMRANNVTV
jgi:glycosyltransferase involved in cell wall biosynthesis